MLSKDSLTKLADELLPELNLELVDLEIEQSRGRRVLRFFVDHPEGGVTVDECASASRKIALALDELEPENVPFILEVSSPGLDRRMARPRDFARFCGRRLQLRLRDAVEGRRNFQGVLKDAGEKAFTIETDGGDLVFGYDDVARANLVFEDGK